MMAEIRYDNRQIERMFDSQNKDLKEHMTLHLDPLTKQVEKTNGTVKFLTKMIYVAIGALIILWPIMVWFIQDYFAFKEALAESVQAIELQQYTKP